MSFRLRLTLWYSAVLAVTLIGGSVALYLALSFNALRPAQDELISGVGNRLAGSLARDGQTPDSRGAAARRARLPQFINSLSEGELSILVRDAAGAVIERSATLADAELPLSEAASAAAQAGRTTFEDVDLDGVRLRLYTAPIQAGGQTVGLVQVARSTRQLEETLSSLRDALLVGNSVLVLVGALAGWFLAGRSLEPVHRITRTAEDITQSGQLDRRVFYRGPKDDLGRLAIAFNDMLGRLEAVFGGQRRFVADASHELRTPLTTLRINLEMLRKERQAAPPHWGEVLDDLVLEAERMTRLVEGLLELARADAGQHLERQPLELDPLLERVERQASPLAEQASVALKLEGRPAGSIVANADALTQLLLILIDNAVKHTPPGGQIWLRRSRENGQVRVTVSDNGAGIKPTELARIFDRFYRAPTARGRRGTGLGLAIARWIAEEHQGSLTAESEPGRGSTFILTLPASPGPQI